MIEFREPTYSDDGYSIGEGVGTYNTYGAAESIGSSSTKRLRFVSASEQAEVDAVRAEFNRLLKRWRKETMFLSSSSAMYFHEAYQRIIGMGNSALPLIFESLKEGTDDWFWALKCITGVDPVPKKNWGDYESSKRAWLKWESKNI